MNKTLKQLVLAFASITALALGGLALVWLTSPTRLGVAAFQGTGLPEHTLEQARVIALSEDKPLLIDFSAYWCGWCRKLDREVFSDPTVRARIERDYVFVRLDSEAPETRPLMRKYNIHAFPSLLVVQADGLPLYGIPVVYDPEAFLDALTVARQES